MESSNEDIPVSDIDEPRITERTIVDDDPICSVCGADAPFTAHNVIGGAIVVRIYKIAEHYSASTDSEPGLPLCDEHYEQTEQYASEREDES